jgi:signal transduction histidine kinase
VPDSVKILVVDDTADKRVALEAILRDLEVEIVQATSGAEALRRLLREDFAVVLLDVRMPGMDGFETAALIRRRPRTAQVPIIFITAFGEETHVARGYSLRAVDYLLTPVVPDVLRTKVAVFVELYRATAAARRQAERLQRRADQLHRLARCSVAIQAARTLEAIVQTAADAARDVLGAEDALVVARVDERRAYRAVARPHGMRPLADTGLHGRPLSEAGIVAAVPANGARPVLTAPLVGRESQNLGLVHAAGPSEGTFGQEEEDLLVQVAHMAAIAIENAVFSEAREANRLKDEFLATVSHELRTPLSAMLSWVWMLRRGGLDDPATSRALEAIERSARSQARLVDDLLDVSRIATGKLQLNSRRVDLVSVVAAAADTAAGGAAAKGVALERLFDPSTGDVVGDPDRLQQVVSNLLSNAVKFTPSGGRIELRVGRKSGHAYVAVCDTGRGIAPDFLPHVFDRFRQADGTPTRQSGGLGLGLAIVRHLVELHGGRVEAESAGDGQGATFSVHLPIAAPAAASYRPDGAVASEDDTSLSPLRGVQVLVVEDDPDTREALVLILGEAGAAVTAVPNAPEALAAIAAGPPQVLVCDIGLPGEDGYALLRRVRALPAGAGGTVPALALTAYARTVDQARALEAGFQAHVAKPFQPGPLVHVVARLVPAAGQGALAAASGSAA